MLFDDLTDVYESMIDWPKRLANEEPLYRGLFARCGVKSVVDVACGTGRHAAMFHSWGLRVEGADLSAAMIDRARAAFGEPPGLRWVQRGFDEPIERSRHTPRAAASGRHTECACCTPPEPFDAAICVGNSLALAPDAATAERSVGQMLAAVRPGGLVIIHVLNFWHLPDGPVTWQKCRRAALPQGDMLIVKGVHRCGSRGYVDLIVAKLDQSADKPAAMQTDSIRFLGLEAADLEAVARRAGAVNVTFFGGYRQQPFDRQESVDLVVAVEK